MVLGLIDFLLGGKKKTQQASNNAQSSASAGNSGTNQGAQQNQQAEGSQSQTQNGAGGSNVQDSNGSSSGGAAQQNPSSGNKKSLSEVLGQIKSELKETSDNIANVNSEIKELQGNVSSLDHRISDLESKNKTTEEKLSGIDENMSKFLSLYELVNNEYNPFIDQESTKPKKILVNNNGSQQPEGSEGDDSNNGSGSEENNSEDVKEKIKNLDLANYKPSQDGGGHDLRSSLLELDTLDIEEAAADAVPLTSIRSNTNSLVIILSWLEYLVKRVGVEESKNALRYYTETLKWITPEVFFELDKFLRGMEDVQEIKAKALDVKDHIVSLYFISKLNEKPLDSKLTSAVLQIIRQE